MPLFFTLFKLVDDNIALVCEFTKAVVIAVILVEMRSFTVVLVVLSRYLDHLRSFAVVFGRFRGRSRSSLLLNIYQTEPTLKVVLMRYLLSFF